MKKFIFFSTILLVLVFSCSDFKNLEIPESVSVKSSATYELPAGKANISLHEKLSITKLRNILNDNISGTSDKPSVYDYNPTQDDDDVLQYIIDYPIKKIPLSISNTDSNIEDINFDTEINLNLQDKVNDTFDLSGAGGTIPVVDLGDEKTYSFEGGATGPKISLVPRSDLDLKTVSFSAGTISVAISAPGTLPSPAGIKLLAKIALYSNGSLVDATEVKDCTNGSTLSISLAGKTLSLQNTYVSISGSYSDTDGQIGDGSAATASYNYSYSPSIAGLVVSKVTGLNMSSSTIGALNVNESKPLSGLNSYLISAKIAEGSLSFSCKLPDGWTGVVYERENSSFTIEQATSGGISIQNSDFTTSARSGYVVNERADLANQIVNTSNVNITGTAKFSLQDATIVLSDSGTGDKLKLEGTCSITELEEVVLDVSKIVAPLSDNIDTGINFSSMLSSFLKNDENLINNVKFSGIRGFVFIQQPTENTTLQALSATATLSETTTSTSLLNNVSVQMKSAEDGSKTLASLSDSNGMITEPWTEETDTSKQIFSAQVASGSLDTILNSHPNNLKFSYTITWGGASGTVTLSSADLRKLQGESSINLSLAIVMPIKIILDDVSDGVSDGVITVNDVLSLFGNGFDEDVLHRDDDWDADKWTKYADVMEGLYFNYELTNSTPMTDVKLTFYDTEGILDSEDEDGNPVIGKTLKTEDGSKDKISFTPDEARKILKTQPFIPKVKMEIQGADGTTIREFSRKATFGLKGTVQLKTDGEVEVWSK